MELYSNNLDYNRSNEIIDNHIKNLENNRLNINNIVTNITFLLEELTPYNIFLIGVGKSGLVCQKCVSTWRSLGIKCHYLDVISLFHGDFGVLIGHSPILSNLRPGVVDLYNDGQISNSLFVDGGFAEVTDERCTLLATNAKHVNEISAEEVAGRLEAAEAQIAEAEENNKNLAERELSAAQAMKYAFETRSSAQLA